MAKFTVWYKKENVGRIEDVKLADLLTSHVGLFSAFEADSKEHLFYKLQGENWSPNGEARPLIQLLGLTHTSMSVGDVVCDEDEEFWLCDVMGWKYLPAR
jgi:hypothetical protein